MGARAGSIGARTGLDRALWCRSRSGPGTRLCGSTGRASLPSTTTTPATSDHPAKQCRTSGRTQARLPHAPSATHTHGENGFEHCPRWWATHPRSWSQYRSPPHACRFARGYPPSHARRPQSGTAHPFQQRRRRRCNPRSPPSSRSPTRATGGDRGRRMRLSQARALWRATAAAASPWQRTDTSS